MEEEKYIIPANLEYSEEIRKLQDSDPASASTVFNPLIERLIENITAVRRMLTADQIMMPDGVTTVSTSLSQKAEVKSPQIYSLPLPDGFTGDIFYFKTQENIVYIYGGVVKSEGTIDPWTTLAPIPEGYRPNYYFPNGVGYAFDESHFLETVIMSYDKNASALRLGSNVPDGTHSVSILPICYLSL